MKEEDDIRDYINKFIETVDRLHDMELRINEDLLVIILLHSFPQSFENCRCAIEIKDELPILDNLKIKICECENEKEKKQ